VKTETKKEESKVEAPSKKEETSNKLVKVVEKKSEEKVKEA